MGHEFLPVLVALVLALALPAVMIFLSAWCGPRAPHAVKSESYECGVPPVGSVRQRHDVKFKRVAILFLLFDVEAALLFPWAVLYRNKIGDWGLGFLVAEAGLFLAVLIAAYAFAWSRGVLEWD